MSLPVFPAQNSIPPACFYNINGLAAYLNKNAPVKIALFYYLFPSVVITSTMSSFGFSPASYTLSSLVTYMQDSQLNIYNNEIALFQKVYGYNSNAYVTSLSTNKVPIYYTFKTAQELIQYRSGVSVLNKLYNFDIISDYWSIPFPLSS
jgi:hypothetical protein